MRVGILGSGLMGGKLGTLFARAGHDVVFSYARTKGKLARLARAAGPNARAGTPGEAAEGADAVLLAVHWSRVEDVLAQAGSLAGTVVVTCSLPMNADDTDLVLAHRTSGDAPLGVHSGCPGAARRRGDAARLRRPRAATSRRPPHVHVRSSRPAQR